MPSPRLLPVIALLAGCAQAALPYEEEGAPDLSARDGARDLARDLRAAAGPPDLAEAPDLAPSACAAGLAALRFDFEASDGAFSHRALDGFAGDGSWPFDEWAWGTPSGAGPGACHGGSRCWSTYLGGNYVSCERAELRSPTLDLSACAGEPVRLAFFQWYDFWTGAWASSSWYDGGIVELSGDGGATWVVAAGAPAQIRINPDMTSSYRCLSPSAFYVHGKAGYTQTSGGWRRVEITIPPALRTDRFMVRFAYGTGVSSQNGTPSTSRPSARPGWTIDDLALELP